MRINKRTLSLILCGFYLVLVVSCLCYAAEPTLKDTKTNPKQFVDQELMVTGTVLHPTVQTEISVKIIKKNKPNTEPERSIKINVYLVNDGIENIMLMTLKTLENGAQVSTRAKVLTTSRYGLKDRALELFLTLDPEGSILKGQLAERTLQNIIENLNSYEPWVMFIDIEGLLEKGSSEEPPQAPNPDNDFDNSEENAA